jgi:hypothetical protein
VGGRAFNAWEQIPEGFLEFCRNQIPKHRRPSARNQELVGRIIAQNLPEHPNGKVFGECDETQVQIATRLHGRLSVGEVAASLCSLDGSVFFITARPAKGRRGTLRTFHPELAYNIAKWERSGAEPVPHEVAVWDERLYGLGYKPQHFGIQAQRSGVSPAPPIEVPIANTNIKPKSIEVSQESTSLALGRTSLLSKEKIQAEIDRYDEIARSTSNPSVRQQAWRRFSDLTAVLHAM